MILNLAGNALGDGRRPSGVFGEATDGSDARGGVGTSTLAEGQGDVIS